MTQAETNSQSGQTQQSDDKWDPKAIEAALRKAAQAAARRKAAG